MFESAIPRILGGVPISLRRALLGRPDHDQFHAGPACWRFELGVASPATCGEKFAFESPAVMNGAVAS
jgi:hypothetical protein